jgi:hypothetical protein
MTRRGVGVREMPDLACPLVFHSVRAIPSLRDSSMDSIRDAVMGLSVATNTYWPQALAVAGPVAAIVVFLSHVLQVRKLRFELNRLQEEQGQRQRWVHTVTSEEIEKYGQRKMRSTA